jgi:hypothetical protein
LRVIEFYFIVKVMSNNFDLTLFNLKASIINDTPVRRVADRQDSLDIISFGTVRSSEDSDSEERKIEKRRTVVDLTENNEQVCNIV